jgi:Holliday junction resolvase RusA-like endonuclease
MLLGEDRWFVIGITAQPWAVGSLGVGYRGKKPYAYIGPNQQLQAYQEALKEQLEGAGMLLGEVEVQLYIWRKLETAKNFGGRDRKAKTSDATNIQKATEDALQGILIENDRNVRRISTEIVAQNENTESCIVVRTRPYQPLRTSVIPNEVWNDIDRVQGIPMADTLPWSSEASNPMNDINNLYKLEGERGRGGNHGVIINGEEIF